jgi:dephospho-CoA kinase
MGKDKIVVGITGTILAGKGTVVDILKSKGFNHVSVRDLIKEELARQNMPVSRSNMQNLGNIMRRKHGLEYWMKIALNKYATDNTPLIIESLRNPAEITYLKNNSKFYLIGMDAPFEVRLERVKKRDLDMDKRDQDTFVFDDARDKGYNEPLNGQQVGMCLVQADFLIYNDEESDRLEDSKIYKEVMEIYDKIMKK